MLVRKTRLCRSTSRFCGTMAGVGGVRDVDFEETVAADSEVAVVFAAGLKSVGIDI